MGLYGGGIKVDIKFTNEPEINSFVGSNRDIILINTAFQWEETIKYVPIPDPNKQLEMNIVDFMISSISWESLLMTLGEDGIGPALLFDMMIHSNKELYYIINQEDQINKDQE